MDPALDPPPVAAQAAAAIPAVAAAPAPAPIATALNHPPYAEMISAAITALNERDGSSKRAIAKYIETNYSDLPPTHSALLTHHLKRLKTGGQLLMVKHSYTLPGLRSALAPAAVNGAVTTVESSADLASTAAKRRPGRPPKPKPDAVHVAVPVFPPPINMNDAPVFASEPPGNATALPENAHIAAVPANGTPVRGRGRPPKQGGAKRGPGRPPKSSSGGGGGSGGRGRGRPKKSGTAAPVAAPAAAPRPGRPRGRPPKPINMVEGFAPVSGGVVAAAPVSAPALGGPVTGKRRGRPPKAGNEAKKPRNMNAALPKRQRNLSGKPLGRPRKNAQATVNRTPDSQLLVAYLDLKAKLENLQSTVKQAATLIRPSLTSEAAVNALQELELVALNVSAPPNAQTQQQPLPEQVQPQS